MRIKTPLLLFVIAVSDAMYSQMPTIQTPDVASINKYIDFPVDISTGVAQINVPIYKVQEGGFSLPISLSYHTGGIKPNEVASSVGLGWSLNAGATISRSVKYRPDEFGYYAQNGFQYTDYQIHVLGGQFHVTNLLANTSEDPEPDIFYFNVNGSSGRFVFDKDRKAHIIPEQDLKIEVLSSPYDFFKFKITTPDGVQYFFDNPDLTSSVGTLTNQDEVESAWKVSKVVTGNLDTIRFNYEFYDFTYNQIEPESKSVRTGYCPVNLLNLNDNTLKSYRIKEILSKTSKVEFVYNSSYREDLKAGDAKALKEIRITDGLSSKVIKKFELTTSYFNSTQSYFPDYNRNLSTYGYINKRLRLDKVQEMTATGDTLPGYKFSYNKYNAVSRLPSLITTGRDHWGYYNGKDSNTTQFANFSLNPSVFYNPNCIAALANREGNESFKKAFILDEIVFPTGGKTAYLYESPSISSVFVGGLRVWQVMNYTHESASPKVKFYEYGDVYMVDGAPVYAQDITIIQPIGINVPVEWQDCVDAGAGYFASSEPINFSGELSSNFLIHEDVAEVVSGNGRIEYKYVIADDLPSNHVDVGAFPLIITYPVLISGKIASETVKDQSGNKIKETVYDYGRYTRTCVSSLDAARVSFASCGQQMFYYPIMTGAAYLKELKETVYGSSSTDTLVSRVQYEYAGIPTQSQINANAPVVHHLISKETTKGSDGAFVIKRMSYPIDYKADIGSYTIFDTWGDDAKGLNSLIENWKISTPIQTVQTREIGGTEYIQSGSLTLFNENTISPSARKIVAPKQMLRYINGTQEEYSSFTPFSIQKSSGHYSLNYDSYFEPEVDFNLYDTNFNLIEFKSKTEPLISIKYGYANSLAVAKISNALYSDVFYTSFESDTGMNIVTDGITGNKSKINGFSHTVNELSGGDYWLTYWQKISGAWIFQESPVNVLSSSYSISLTGQVDEIRFYPKAALMQTYTYDPLVGMTSQCDAKSMVTYYDYDDFNRLRVVRDHKKRVLRKICYNYSGQPENCLSPCTNTTAEWQNTATALRCQLNAGQNTGYQEQEQKDMNPCSPTYNQLRWVQTAYNTTACPLPAACNSGNCSGNDKKCINGICETGVWSLISATRPNKSSPWTCVYAYVFSDGSTSTYTETIISSIMCALVLD